MTTQKESPAATLGYDEDNWDKTKNAQANADCPNDNPFVMIPSTINGKSIQTRWWTNYWWGMNEWGKGTYVYGDNGQFDSCFDPKKFYEQTSDGLKLKAFYDTNRINPDDHKNYPSWVTSEIVLGGLDPSNDYDLPGYGHYAVIAKAADFGGLDPSVVLGIFTYQFGKAANPDRNSRTCLNLHREIDLLETIAQSQQGLPGNAQFALQPASPDPKPTGTSLWRFTIPNSTPVITAYLYWGDPMDIGKETRVRIYAGDYTLAQILGPTPPQPMKDGDWRISNDSNANGHKWVQNVPQCKNQRMHINLYVPGGNHSQADKGKSHEVYVKRFEFSQG